MTEQTHSLPDVFVNAHTARSFPPGELDANLLAEVWDEIKFGPTAFNSTPLRLLAVSPAQRQRLVERVMEGNQDRVAQAPMSVVLAYDAALADEMAERGLRAAEMVRSNAEKIARENAWLQFGYLVVALRARGLGVGPMTGIDAAAIKEEFLADSSWVPFAVLNIGLPDTAASRRAPRPEARTVIAEV